MISLTENTYISSAFQIFVHYAPFRTGPAQIFQMRGPNLESAHKLDSLGLQTLNDPTIQNRYAVKSLFIFVLLWY